MLQSLQACSQIMSKISNSHPKPYLKLSQITSHYLKLSQIISNYLKLSPHTLSQIISNYLKLSQIISNYLKLSQIISNYLKLSPHTLSQIISNYLKLSQIKCICLRAARAHTRSIYGMSAARRAATPAARSMRTQSAACSLRHCRSWG